MSIAGFLRRLRSAHAEGLFTYEHSRRLAFDRLGIVGPCPTPDETLQKTFEWIRASFHQNGRGGSAASYSFRTGWGEDYPETTGYLIPTLYDYGSYTRDAAWSQFARRAADWLTSIQLPEGGWQGLQVGVSCEPRVFNTAMVLDGLIAAYRAEDDHPRAYLEAAQKGLHWTLEQMSPSGRFEGNNVAGGGAFDTLVCAALLLVTEQLPSAEQARILPRIRRALDSHCELQMPNGAFLRCNFQEDGRMLLHHLGYTLDGLLTSADLLKADAYYAVARKTLGKLLSRFEVELELPAYLDLDWSTHYDHRSGRASLCLTGYSQIAICFQKVYEKEQDYRFLNAALKINDIVGSIANYESRNAGLRYGVAGSYPIDGAYHRFQFVNWAAKYHADSVLRSLGAVSSRRAA